MSHIQHNGITLLQRVLALEVAPQPASDVVQISIVHVDARGDAAYWCGKGNGHDGQGWTRDEVDASTFSSWSAANLERRRAKAIHPTLRITLQGNWS